MELKEISSIHFIGIGGIGASSLAQILKEKGKIISGSDQKESAITDQLQETGIKLHLDHKKENISIDCELVIYSHAIPENNPELQQAKQLEIPCITYPEGLALLSKDYFTVAISGTHGKSTTTAMTALALTEAGLDPTVIIGTKLKEFGGKNFRVGESKYLVMEACEYKSSFLNLNPQILAVTNIEAEHLDYFKTEENYYQNFYKLAEKLDDKSTLIINKKDPRSLELGRRVKCETIHASGEIDFELQVPGDFNKQNASIATEISKQLNADEKGVKKALQSFTGSWRRMEKKNLPGYNCQFIDDYAHHPTEILVTLAAIREANQTVKILCVFQPHQYSRTHNLLQEFAESFKNVDQVIIPNIHQVRDSEEDIAKVSPEKLVEAINNESKNAIYGEGLENSANYIKESHNKFDIVITMGAGDITSIYGML